MITTANRLTKNMFQLVFGIIHSRVIRSIFWFCMEPEAKENQMEQRQFEASSENLKIQCKTSGRCNSSAPQSPIPDTPASKGYTIESNFVEGILGTTYYFVTPIHSDDPLNPGQTHSYYAVFGLSPKMRMVSRVDESSAIHFYHHDRSPASVIRFEIGDLSYRWEIQRNTLSEQVNPELSDLGFMSSKINLYTDLKEAQTFAQELRQAQSLQSLHSTGFSITDDTTIQSHRFTHSASYSPEVPPTLTETSTFDPLFQVDAGFFAPFPTREAIDAWVDHGVATNQAARDGNRVKCPEPGCDHSSRRPGALKIHLYTHYRIKPYR
ncbi:unnamed protein product [Rhizoctonia solani]|uniref:C2H2-type domain-containing protein n=1 Tax=Rhizoctonia solani TaxID=456999 RepID=A0A8H3A3H4_9AGAM|nr:unnamed protein product [Rhizoctonia solani]